MPELTKNIYLDQDLDLFSVGKPVTRPSCIECVIKHYSAALVLSSEILAGYKEYEYLFIGHLHEAHEEAQEFPKLYCLLVNSRREYQRDGVMPNFEKIAEIIEETKKVIIEFEKK